MTFLFAILFSFIISSTSLAAESTHTLHIDRAGHQLYVLDANKKIVYQAPVGIGRGGLKEKKSMKDQVTPTGTFAVDLILSQDSKWNAIAEENKKLYPGDLRILFDNMNRIDFDGNATPDHAYGSAYIGLDSKTAVTGPKLSRYGRLPYWYSIAIHGTPDPANVGQSNSGGCVHLSEKDIRTLMENRWVQVGTAVTISDTTIIPKH